MAGPSSISEYIDAAKLVVQAAATIASIPVVIRGVRSKREAAELTQFNLVFPHDLERFGISMRFDFMQYRRRSIYDQPFLSPQGKVRLPVPGNLIDRQAMDWSQAANGPLLGAAMESGLDYGKNQVQTKTALEVVGDTVFGASIAGLQKSANDLGGYDVNQLLQPTGLATNPFLTVLFKQPVFKTHSFSWHLIARDSAESLTINNIAKTFRYHMLPDVASGTAGTLLNYPDIVQPKFFQNDAYLYRFKPCVITSFSIDNSPSGPAFFKGSANSPAEIVINLELLEIEYWTKVDFEHDMNPNLTVSTSTF